MENTKAHTHALSKILKDKLNFCGKTTDQQFV